MHAIIIVAVILINFVIFYATTVTETRKTKLSRAQAILDTENAVFVVNGIEFTKVENLDGTWVIARFSENGSTVKVDAYYASTLIN